MLGPGAVGGGYSHLNKLNPAGTAIGHQASPYFGVHGGGTIGQRNKWDKAGFNKTQFDLSYSLDPEGSHGQFMVASSPRQ